MITRTTCRVCDGSLESVLDLGDHYVSDFISPAIPTERRHRSNW